MKLSWRRAGLVAGAAAALGAVSIGGGVASAQTDSSGYVGAVASRAFVLRLEDERPRVEFLDTETPVFRAFGLSAGRLLYSPLRGGAPSGELWVEDLEGRSRRRVTAELVLEAAWSPANPDLVALTYSGGDRFGLAVVELESGRVRARTEDGVFADRVAWSPDGRGVHYLSLTNEEDVSHQEAPAFAPEPSFVVRYLPLDQGTPRSEAGIPRGFPTPVTGPSVAQAFPEPSRTPAFRLLAPGAGHEVWGESLLGPGRLRLKSPSSADWIEAGEAQLLAALDDGLVLRRFEGAASRLSFLSWKGAEHELAEGLAPFGGAVPFAAITNGTPTYNLPLASLFVTQGGGSYAPPGNCNVAGHTGTMAYAFDMQRQVLGAHVLASAVGTVVYYRGDVTCNSADTAGCSDYSATCTGTASNSGWGNTVILQHADGTYTKYSHMQAFSLRVAVGGVACQGFWMGNQGHTGASVGSYNGCGDHVHFQRQSSSALSGQSVATTFDDVGSNPLSCTSYSSGSTEIQTCPSSGPPSVTTLAASGVGQTSATLNATVNPNGSSTSGAFDYGLTTSYGSSTGSVSLGSGSSAVPMNVFISGLTCGQTYHFRARATNGSGTAYGSDQTFNASACAASPPTVTTLAASGVGQTSATLNATVNPNGSSTTGAFDYGLTTSYGSATGSVSLGSGSSGVAMNVAVSGLGCGNTYHFRARATNSGGTAYGSDRTFVTVCPGTPSITVTSPNGGEVLRVGTNHLITWTSANLDPTGGIQLFYLDGSWQYLGATSTTSTSFNWLVPAMASPVSRVFVGNAVSGSWQVTDESNASFVVQQPTRFYTVTPCRVADTRSGAPLAAGTTRTFAIAGLCGVPAEARSVAVNVTVVAPGAAGNLRVFPSGLPLPLVSTLNYSAAQTRGNNAVLPLGAGGSLDVACTQSGGSAHVVIDVSGYYQ